MIAAAGGLLWRYGPAGIEVGLIHRDRYNDWTLPKGKLEAGETELVAAVREVGEETGSTVSVSRSLGSFRYLVQGSPKSVRFWAMRQTGGTFTPNEEVDGLDWLTPAAAYMRMSYDIDREVLRQFGETPVPDAVVALVRHAKAGRRSEWRGPDRLRPLEKEGRRQARRLVEFLRPFAPTRVLTADRVRCAQTVAPLASALDLPLETVPTFSDESYEADPAASLVALLALGAHPESTVVCSQGVTIPSLLEDLADVDGPVPASTATRKGAVWVLSFADGRVVSVDGYPDAAR